MKHIKLFESFDTITDWLESLESVVEQPWQEDSEIAIIAQWQEMLDYYNDNYKNKPKQARDYFDRWVIANDDAVMGNQTISDGFISAYENLKAK